MRASRKHRSAIVSFTGIALAILALGATFAATPAPASTIVVGSPLSADFSTAFLVYAERETVANVALPEPWANVTSPIDGTITSWRVAYAQGGPFTLRVLEPQADGTYRAVASSAPRTPASVALESFPTSLPIKAGDTVGIDNSTKTDTLGASPTPGTAHGIWKPFLPDGARRAPVVFAEGEGVELAFDAVVVGRPAVVLLSPAGGPVGGGTPVAIAGHDLRGATAVKFGAATTSFSVVSDNLITAVSPRVGAPGTVDVTVTSAGGQSVSTAADKFTYSPVPTCMVPKLTGKGLAAVRRLLKRGGCALGKVRGRKARSAKVTKQSAKPGKVLHAGSKVSIKLG
jgi:hypothetical protein